MDERFFGRSVGLQRVEVALLPELVVDEQPTAVGLGVDLALALGGGTAARPVLQSLGAAGDGADVAGLLQGAVAAGRAVFAELAEALDAAEEQGVGGGVHGLVGGLGGGLSAGAAGHDEHSVGGVDLLAV